MERCLFCFTSYIKKPSWSQLLLNETDSDLCLRCLRQLKRLEGNRCLVCSRQLLEINWSQDDCCFDCIRWQRDKRTASLFDRNISVYQYNPFMKETLARYKYRGDAVIAQFFAPKLYELYLKHFKGYVVIPIPLSQERLLERGFNQSELLLTGWKKATINPLLQRINREKQSKKSRRLRLASFDDNPFSVNEELNNFPQKLNKAILIDDIYTTGTTLRQAAYVLKQIGVQEVASLTIAR